MSLTSRWRVLPAVLALIHVSTCQRYADRVPLQADTRPLYDRYDDMSYAYDSDGYYDFAEESDVYRWNVEDYPNPVKSPMYCHRVRASYVCDPDLVLTKDQADELDKLIRALFNETPCICNVCQSNNGGIRFGIALMKNIFQPYNEHPSKIIRAFAEKLRTKWALGECNNDIVIVLATTDRLFYTDVGTETSNYVSSEEAYRIFLEKKALFSAGQFYDGLRAILEDYKENTKSLSKIQPIEDTIDVAAAVGSVIGVVALTAIIVLVVCVYAKKCRSSDTAKKIDEGNDNAEGDRSSWRRKDIKVIFGSLLPGDKSVASDQYSPCKTDEIRTQKEDKHPEYDDDEVIDTTLQVCSIDVPDQAGTSPEVEVTSASETKKEEEMEDSNATESDVFIKPLKLSSFESPSGYGGPVTNF